MRAQVPHPIFSLVLREKGKYNSDSLKEHARTWVDSRNLSFKKVLNDKREVKG